VIGNVEVYDDTTIAQLRGTGPIFTAGASATADGPAYEHNILNHSDLASLWSLEYEPQYSTAEMAAVGASQNVVALTAAATLTLMWASQAGEFKSRESVVTVVVANTLVAGQNNRAFIWYDPDSAPNQFAISNGTIEDTDTTYDGFTLGSVLTLGYQVDLPAGIRDVRRYSVPDYATAEKIKDEINLEAV
jgi:hypothetical protein